MTPPNSDDRHQGRPVVSVRVDKPVNDDLEALIDEDDSKADVTREVIRRGIAAYQLDDEPRELAERVEELEDELDRSAWERLGTPLRVLLLAVSGAVASFIVLLVGASASALSLSGVVWDRFIPVGLSGVLLSVVVMVSVVAVLMYRQVREEIEPNI